MNNLIAYIINIYLFKPIVECFNVFDKDLVLLVKYKNVFSPAFEVKY